MRSLALVIALFALSFVTLYAQRNEKKSIDRIFLVTGEIIECKILSEDSLSVNYAVKEKGINVTSSITKNNIDHISYGAYENDGATENENSYLEKFSLGVGIGQDYGGFGGNVTFYANKNVGFFAGVGQTPVGLLGINGGLKIRMDMEKEMARVIPFFTAMYGYNTIFSLADYRQWDKIFYGPTVGFGIDVHQKHPKRGLWCFGLLVPIRGNKPDQYVDMVKSNLGVNVTNDFFPIHFSIGYRFKFE